MYSLEGFLEVEKKMKKKIIKNKKNVGRSKLFILYIGFPYHGIKSCHFHFQSHRPYMEHLQFHYILR